MYVMCLWTLCTLNCTSFERQLTIYGCFATLLHILMRGDLRTAVFCHKELLYDNDEVEQV